MSADIEPKVSANKYWQQHHSLLKHWINSGFKDAAAISSAIQVLGDWFNEYPNHARDIQHLAISATMTAYQAAHYTEAFDLMTIARDANDLILTRQPEQQAAMVAVSIIGAVSKIKIGDTADDEDLLGYASTLLQQLDESHGLHVFLKMQLEWTRGASMEAVLEYDVAATHFQKAIELGDPLLRNRKLERQLVRDWLSTMYGNGADLVENGAELGKGLVLTILQRTYTLAAFGAARTVTDKVDQAANLSLEIAREFGIPEECTTFELRAILVRLSPQERLQQMEKLLEDYAKVHSRRAYAICSIVYSLRARTRVELKIDGYLDDIEQAIKAAQQARDYPTWCALSADSPMIPSVTGDNIPMDSKAFLHTYQHTADRMRKSHLFLPFRAHFESDLDKYIAAEFEAYDKQASQATQIQLSLLLETARNPLLFPQDLKPEVSALDASLKLSADMLGRLRYALQDHKAALCIIPQTVSEETIFICISGGESGGIFTARAGKSMNATSFSLAERTRQAIYDQSLNDSLEELGENAYNALPLSVQQQIAASHEILIAPDFSADHASVPYELFHDGQEYLGLIKVIARFSSLRTMLMALESSVTPGIVEMQSLCASLPDAIPDKKLLYASGEIHAVQELLKSADWQSMTLENDDVDQILLLKGLVEKRLVHIAAHGSVANGKFAVVLTKDRRLTGGTLNRYRGSFSAMVFLNTCSLGRSRYLGGGVSRGMAYTLNEKGAPCVIANLQPTMDRSATMLSVGFYNHAMNRSAGEALRLSRKMAVKNGIPPAFWSTVILVGNPYVRLVPEEMTHDDLLVRLLRAGGPGRISEETAAAIFNEAEAALSSFPDDVRLHSALTWARWARELSAETGNWYDERALNYLAILARDLGYAPGHGMVLAYKAEHYLAEGEKGRAKESLDDAIDVLAATSIADDDIHTYRQTLLIRRYQLDDHEQPKTIVLDSGLRVNDYEDPATRAFFAIQQTVDQEEIVHCGKHILHRPVRDLDDYCWNAVVFGQEKRFKTDFSRSMAAQALARQLPAQTHYVTKYPRDVVFVIMGLLPHLWLVQRMTHLEHDRALHQAATLASAIRIAEGSGDAFNRLAALDQQLGLDQEDDANATASKFKRALKALESKHSKFDSRAVLAGYQEIIEAGETQEKIACSAAWCLGRLLDAYLELLKQGSNARAAALFSLYQALESNSADWFMPFFSLGSEVFLHHSGGDPTRSADQNIDDRHAQQLGDK